MKTGTRHLRCLARTASVAMVLALTLGSLAGCGTDITGDLSTTDSEPGIAPVLDTFSDDALEGEMMAEESMMRASGSGEDVSHVPAEDRFVIRNKSLRLEVEDVRDAVGAIRDLASDHDAIVTNVTVSTDDGYVYRYDEYGMTMGSGEALSGWVTVRVPADEFEAFVDAADDLGEVLWESESIDDVTQQHVDLSARLENLKAQEARLREFFDAADTVDEMLQIERELSRVRGEIESLTAQIAYLERQAAMATVTIELSEPKPVVRPDGPDWGFSGAITAGLQLAANVVQGLIVVGLGVFPILLIAIIIFVIVRAIVRSRRERKTSEEG